MDGKLDKKILALLVAVVVLFTTTFAGAVTASVYYSELEQCRTELGYIRAELDAATDRQSELTELVRGSGEILSQSVNTVADLRNQIREIRSNYEKMESLLLSVNTDSDN